MNTTPHVTLPVVLQRYTELFATQALDPTPYIDPESLKTLVLLPVQLFQRLAYPLSYGDKHKSKEDRTEAAKGKWDELPYLTLKIDCASEECLVVGHEGRHRTIWMDSHDISLVPVVFWVLRKTEKHGPGDSLRWGTDDYRPKFIRSQNKKLLFPMPQSIVFPKSIP